MKRMCIKGRLGEALRVIKARLLKVRYQAESDGVQSLASKRNPLPPQVLLSFTKVTG